MTTTRDVRRVTVPIATLLAAVLALGAVAGAGVSQSFSDVPSTHLFFEEIEEVAGACIAQGFPDGTFRPGDEVKREAMAAFFARAGSRHGGSVELGGGSPTFGWATPHVHSPWSAIAQGTMTLPDDGCERTVSVQGHTTVYTNDAVADTCHMAVNCNVELGLFVDGVQVGSNFVRLNHDYAAESLTAEGQATTMGSSVSYHLRIRTYNVKPGTARGSERSLSAGFAAFDASVLP
jgi:hypothetical protein